MKIKKEGLNAMSDDTCHLEDFYAPCAPISLHHDGKGNFGGFAHYLSRISAVHELDGQAVLFTHQPIPEVEGDDFFSLTDLEYIPLNSEKNKKMVMAAITQKMNKAYAQGEIVISRLVYFIDEPHDLALMDGNFEPEDFAELFAIAERALFEDEFTQLRQALGIFVHSGQYSKEGHKQAIHLHIVYAVPPEYSSGLSIHTIRQEAPAYHQIFLSKYGK